MVLPPGESNGMIQVPLHVYLKLHGDKQSDKVTQIQVLCHHHHHHLRHQSLDGA